LNSTRMHGEAVQLNSRGRRPRIRNQHDLFSR
jgi:hypothetical protein